MKFYNRTASENKEVVLFAALGILTILGITIGLTLVSTEVTGVNNETVITKLNVTNTAPSLYRVTVTPISVDLTPGGTKLVNCTGDIYDANGYSDISNVSGSIYDSAIGDVNIIDKNYRYYNSSCECTQIAGSPTNASCSCLFYVEYYANNGTWQCNMTVNDTWGLRDTANSSLFTINDVVGIEVINEIDYGNLSISETSNTIPVNISNYGNLPINISVRAWGGTTEYNAGLNSTCMICESGNISIDSERYTTESTVDYADMTNITNTSTNIVGFYLPVRNNDTNYGNDTNTTYWAIRIPTQVSGFCNGSIEFTGISRA
ncbi:MAG: hypothetical protein KAK00_01335 [Nanoarchaeota archaeon]|nr:hypothetical protein [Nanoarchaeota archaeon]